MYFNISKILRGAKGCRFCFTVKRNCSCSFRQRLLFSRSIGFSSYMASPSHFDDVSSKFLSLVFVCGLVQVLTTHHVLQRKFRILPNRNLILRVDFLQDILVFLYCQTLCFIYVTRGIYFRLYHCS